MDGPNSGRGFLGVVYLKVHSNHKDPMMTGTYSRITATFGDSWGLDVGHKHSQSWFINTPLFDPCIKPTYPKKTLHNLFLKDARLRVHVFPWFPWMGSANDPLLSCLHLLLVPPQLRLSTDKRGQLRVNKVRALGRLEV